jgi:hypothetical protein
MQMSKTIGGGTFYRMGSTGETIIKDDPGHLEMCNRLPRMGSSLRVTEGGNFWAI